MARPGKIASHQAEKLVLALLNILPQLSSSGEVPIPKKDRDASRSIAEAIPKAMVIKTGVMALGMACLQIILDSLKPMAFAASI